VLILSGGKLIFLTTCILFVPRMMPCEGGRNQEDGWHRIGQQASQISSIPIVNTTVVCHLTSETYAHACDTGNILARNIVRSVEDYAVYAAGAGLYRLDRGRWRKPAHEDTTRTLVQQTLSRRGLIASLEIDLERIQGTHLP
jgi:hypothetical protein